MKIGFLGAGVMARTMARTVMQMKEVGRCAVAARDPEWARAFAQEFGFEKSFGSYEELLADPQVELVYVALPHSHHCAWTKAALEAGRGVLCEKAFAVNERQAREMIGLSEQRGLLLAEAIWTRYMPSRQMIAEAAADGTIGDVCTLSANLGYPVGMNRRMADPALAGGALLDLTVYPLNFASMVLGNDIRRVRAGAVMTERGVDGQDTVMLEYRDGKMASLFATMYGQTDRRGTVCGTKGYLTVENINNPQRISVYRNSGAGAELVSSREVPPQISGYEYEVRACIRAMEEGRTECPEMPHAETLELMRQMDAIRGQWGMTYPCE